MTETKISNPQEEPADHVHGPHCSHGHHHFHEPAQPYIRDPKIGRNDICPCGSAKKFKKCCGKGK